MREGTMRRSPPLVVVVVAASSSLSVVLIGKDLCFIGMGGPKHVMLPRTPGNRFVSFVRARARTQDQRLDSVAGPHFLLLLLPPTLSL